MGVVRKGVLRGYKVSLPACRVSLRTLVNEVKTLENEARRRVEVDA